MGAECVGAGVGGGRDRRAHSRAVADQAFELHRDLGVVSDRQGELAELEAVEPGAEHRAPRQEGVEGGVYAAAGGFEKVLKMPGARSLGDWPRRCSRKSRIAPVVRLVDQVDLPPFGPGMPRSRKPL